MTGLIAYLGTLTFRSLVSMFWGRAKQAVTGDWFPAGAVVVAVTVVGGWLLWSHYSAKWDAVRETERKRDQHWEHQIAKTNAAAAEQQLVRDRTARQREAQMRARWDDQIASLQSEVTKREALIAELRKAGEDPVLTRRQIRLFRRGARQ